MGEVEVSVGINEGFFGRSSIIRGLYFDVC